MPADAMTVIETLQDAAQENKLSSLRRGQTVVIPPDEGGEVFMTGDIHDHRSNFAKLIARADLANNPQRHLILHELIHGEHLDADGAEDSWQMLYQSAELKLNFPEQVHFLLANHDLAQIHGEGISKGGASVCEAFNKGIKRDFAPDHARVQVAVTEFLLSFPLAVRTGAEGGYFFSHSLPNEDHLEGFDYTVFEREELTSNDYAKRTGPVYRLIWGRRTPAAGVEKFLTAVKARTLVTGHQPQDMGWSTNGPQHLIIASDHNQGVYLPIALGEGDDVLDSETLAGRTVKFVSVVLE